MKFRKLLTITRILPLMIMIVAMLTGCEKDEDPGVRPEVTSTNPLDNATNIAVNSTVSSTFNTEMNPASITNTSFSLKHGSTLVAGTATYTGMTASFVPAQDLDPNTLYTAAITTGVRSKTGTTAAQNYEWTFTTGAVADIIVPNVTLSSPVTGATNVALDHAITITFSEPMDQATITNTSFVLKQGTTAVPGTVSYTGTTATFAPDSDLSPNKEYTATVTTAAKDLAGNALAGNLTLTFATGASADIVLPAINTTNPLNNATGIARNQSVHVTFSEAMDPATITTSTMILEEGANAISGTVSYTGTTASFNPSAILAANTTFKATIKTGAKDLAGNALAANTSWEFTTGGTTSVLAAVNLGTAGNYVILAQSAINNGSTSAITGDIALSPAATSYITGLALTNATGYATSTQVTGKVYAADMADPTPSI